MVITALAASHSSLPSAPAAAASSQHRPEEDWWQLGADRFETSQLLGSGRVPTLGVEASYHFKLGPDETTDKPRNVLAGAAAGAAVGAVVGGGGAALMAVAGEILSVLLSGPYYRGGGGSAEAFILGAAAVCAVAGGVLGATGMLAGGKDHDENGSVVRGLLRSEPQTDGTSRIAFYPGGDVRNRIDLNEYARATELPEVDVPAQAWWKDSLKGAGVGAAAGPALFVPLAGVLAPAVVGAKVGDALSGGEAYGGVLGAAAGIGVTAGSIVAMNSLGIGPGLALVSGVTGLAGAALGPVVLPTMRHRDAEAAQLENQWWFRAHQGQSGGAG